MRARQAVTTLAQRKALARERIAATRRQTSAAASRVIQPLRWADDMVRVWRGLPPFVRTAAVPSLLPLLKLLFPRVSTILRWSPLLRGVWRFFRARRKQAAT